MPPVAQPGSAPPPMPATVQVLPPVVQTGFSSPLVSPRMTGGPPLGCEPPPPVTPGGHWRWVNDAPVEPVPGGFIRPVTGPVLSSPFIQTPVPRAGTGYLDATPQSYVDASRIHKDLHH